MVLLTKIKLFKIMCIPNFVLNKYMVRTSTAFNIETNKIYFPPKMKEGIKKCIDDEDTRFIFFTFIIIFSKKCKLSHANIIVIDLVEKTVERFEPYGKTVPDDIDDEIQITIDKLFTEFVLKFINLGDYEYLSPIKISQKFGIQTVADAYCGMCITISMMYLQLRIMNPDIPPKIVINNLLKIPRDELLKKVLRYAKYVENTLKHEKKLVQFLNKELYDKL